MAPCAGNTITPKMIRTGQMKIGDRIHLEDIVASTPEFRLQDRQKPQNPPQSVETAASRENTQSEDFAASKAVSSPAAKPAEAASQKSSDSQTEADTVLVQGPAPSMQQPQTWQMHPQQNWQPQMPQSQPQQNWQPQMPNQSWNPGQNTGQNTGQGTNISTPLTYDQMTQYLNQNAVNTQGNQPYVTIPQTPMTTQEFTETIEITDVQNYLGFLRTQIGRYMRVEQLMGSNIVENRYGFLVGIGSNFIILQEITSGNIMLVDLFTIRLTYIYYSDPVVPPGVQQ